jgi:cytochrome c551/c552
MKNRFTAILLITFLVLRATHAIADNAIVSPDKGKAIFTTQCTSCHNVNAQVVGPALANVDQRHTVDWIVNFVHSPKTLIQNNDKAAVALYNQFNQIIMPDHLNLSEDDVKNILSYIKSETKNTATTEAPFAKPGKLVPDYYPLSIQKNYVFFISYLSAVLVLVLLLVFAVSIKDMQRKSKNILTTE